MRFVAMNRFRPLSYDSTRFWWNIYKSRDLTCQSRFRKTVKASEIFFFKKWDETLASERAGVGSSSVRPPMYYNLQDKLQIVCHGGLNPVSY